MLQSALLLVLGLVLLTAGAESLVRGGASLARRLGLTPLVVGLTVVAFGTSAPELVVSVTGALRGSSDLAAGNVVGSNIFNVAVILGLAALITPLRIQRTVIRREAPLMLTVSLLGAGLLLGGGVPRAGGFVLVLLLGAYTVVSVALARREAGDGDADLLPLGRNLATDLVFIAAGLGLLVGGSRLFVDGALVIARSFGVSEAILGLTIVAAGTSLPELATSIVAAFRRQADIAVGNILGSNIFNVLGVLGTTAIVRPLRPEGLTPLDLVVMVGLAVVLVPLIVTGRRLERWEGAVLLAVYGGYLWGRWPGG